jgi:hypothetical protein
MATRIGAVAYVENSALTKEGVRNVSFDDKGTNVNNQN